MVIDFLREVSREYADEPWIIWKGAPVTYGSLAPLLARWTQDLDAHGIGPGDVVALVGDFSPGAIGAFLALLERECVVVPIASAAAAHREERLRVAQATASIAFDAADNPVIAPLPGAPAHPLYAELRRRQHPGLVLFSSGSTGQSKAAVHDMVPILEKFKVRRRRLRTIAFLLFDHIGGVNTMLHTLSNGGTLVVVPDRTPDAVLAAVARFEAELLPTSPTFINLMLLSEAYRRHDLSSLRIVSYGTEPMPETTLRRLAEIMPDVTLQQTYGLSELGILRSKSRESASTWVKIGGEGFQTRVVDGILQIRAESAMLGYLNADSPFTEDGWFDTGDLVTVDGEYMQIHGRRSELINVGGEKVHPTEVENVIQSLPSVAEVTVYGEKNPIVGHIVCASVRKADDTPDGTLRAEIKRLCAERLEPFKVPLKIIFTSDPQYGDRFKKQRNRTSDAPAG